jgi:hypothetical protein
MKKLKFNADEKVNEIFRTSDYEKFKLLNGNRKRSQKKINTLAKKMKKHGWLETVEITVNQYFQVIDGQHRLEAAKIAGIPVLYKIVEDAGLNEVIKTNSGSSNWTIKDHIPSQINLGNKNIILLDQMMKQFPELTLSICQMMITQTNKNPDRELVETGEWEIGDYNKGILWCENLMSLKPHFEGYKITVFVRAMIDLLNNPNFDFQEFFHKVKLRPTMLVRCGKKEQYIALVEEIYNYKRTGKINLRF